MLMLQLLRCKFGDGSGGSDENVEALMEIWLRSYRKCDCVDAVCVGIADIKGGTEISDGCYS